MVFIYLKLSKAYKACFKNTPSALNFKETNVFAEKLRKQVQFESIYKHGF